MLELVVTDNLQGLQVFIEDADVHSPGHWQTGEDRFTLRMTTNNTIRLARLEFVQYLCGEQGVPALGDNPVAHGTSLLSRRPSHRTPTLLAFIYMP